MKKILITIGFVGFCTIAQTQEMAKNVESIRGKILNPTFLRGLDEREAKVYEKDVLPFLTYLNATKKELNKVKTAISLGFKGNDNYQNSSRYDFTTGFELNTGYYPYKLLFRANLSTQFVNGVLQENISDFKVALNFHLNGGDSQLTKMAKDIELVKDNLLIEGYVQADRYANQYLNIEQRYEVGGGFIFNWYSSTKSKQKKEHGTTVLNYDENYFSGLTEKGKKKLKNLYEKPSIVIDTSEIKICRKKKCPLPVSPYKGIHIGDSLTLVKEYNKISNAIKKKYSKFKIAGVLGSFYEIEKGKAVDSIVVSNRKKEISRDIETTNFLRWKLGAILEHKTDYFQLQLMPTLKLPMPWDWNSREVSSDFKESVKTDYLFDLQFRAIYTVSEKFDINFQLNHIYDNAPKRLYLNTVEGIPLLSAKSNHTFFNFTLSYKI